MAAFWCFVSSAPSLESPLQQLEVNSGVTTLRLYLPLSRDLPSSQGIPRSLDVTVLLIDKVVFAIDAVHLASRKHGSGACVLEKI